MNTVPILLKEDSFHMVIKIYGSFNSILEEQKDELDHDTVVISLVLGNTIAEDIIHLLEHFIDEDLRRRNKTAIQ